MPTRLDEMSKQISGRIYVAGHRGMVGQAFVRALGNHGCGDIISATRAELNLLDQEATKRFLKEQSPDVMIIAAAKVGGIVANERYPADFLYENLMIAANLIHAAFDSGVSRLLFLGSSCIYPKLASQPIREEELLTGALEPTNEGYAIAKIAGLKLCEFYRRQKGCLFHSAMPCNLYGPGDNYHAEHSHVIPGLLRKFHQAKISGDASVTIWGTGTPRREFLFVDDLAEACLRLLEIDSPPSVVNIGAGEDISIRDLAGLIAETVGFKGRILTDPEKSDGVARKLMDSSFIQSLGWKPGVALQEGLNRAYRDFCDMEGE